MAHRNMFVLMQACLVGSSLLALVTATAPQCQGESCESREEDRHSLLQSFRKQSASQETYDCAADSCGDQCYKRSTGSWGTCDAHRVCQVSPVSVECQKQCQGDSKTWRSRWGNCQTYATTNKDHCKDDKDVSRTLNGGLSASEVCPECGLCTETTTTTTTTMAFPACLGDAETWASKWGACQTYASEKQNFKHCHSDRDTTSTLNRGLLASEVCAECGSCAAATTTSLACLGDSETWLSRHGPCWTYASPGSNFDHCSADQDASGTLNSGLSASQVCAECGICTKVTPTTTTTTTVCAAWGHDPWDPKLNADFKYNPKRAQCCGDAKVVQCEYGQRCGYCPACAKTGEDIWNPKWPSRPVFCCDLSNALNCDGTMICGKCPTTTTTTPACAAWGKDPWDASLNPESKYGPKRAKCCGDAKVASCEYGQRCGYCPACAKTGEDVWNPKWPSHETPVACCDGSNPINCDGKIICGQCPTTSTTTMAETTEANTMPKYQKAKRGKCEPPYSYIESKPECEAAAGALELKDIKAGYEKTADPDDADAVTDFPEGCYYISQNEKKSRRLYFRKKGSKSSSSKKRRAICVLLA